MKYISGIQEGRSRRLCLEHHGRIQPGVGRALLPQPRLLNDILLRGEWGFDGAVITDWGGAHDTKQAALNGLDIEMGTWTNGLTSESKSPYSDYYLANPYLNMIRSGEVPESTVDDKARNILRLIFRTAMNPDRPFGSATSPEHYAAAKRIGDEAIVLLKNNGILPLDPTKYKKVLKWLAKTPSDSSTRVAARQS